MKLKRSAGLTLISRCFSSSLSDPTEILGRVHVSIVDAAAFGARPFPDVQGLTFSYVTAIATTLRGREPSVHFNQRFPIPLGLVFKVANELAPTGIADGLRQRAALHWSSTSCASLHVLDRQGLAANRQRAKVPRNFSFKPLGSRSERTGGMKRHSGAITSMGWRTRISRRSSSCSWQDVPLAITIPPSEPFSTN